MSGDKGDKKTTEQNGTADVIPFELLKLDRAVASRLEEVLDFVPDSKRLVKEAFRKLRTGDRTAFESMDGPVRDYLEAELLRLIQTDPSLREIVTGALMREAQASIIDERSAAFAADLSMGEQEAVSAFRASLDDAERELIYDLMTTAAAASQRSEDRFAASLFNEAIARAPDYFEAYLLRGVNHARHGRSASALQDAEVALSLCPDSGRAFELKASALRGLDREDEAMNVLTTAVGRLPEASGLRVMRGAGYLRQGAFRDAVRDLDTGVKCGAGAIAYILRGEARIGLEAYASAQKDFEAALALDSEHPRALGGLVQSLSRRKRWQDLVSAATSLLELIGPDPEVLAHRAHARLEMGRSFMALLDGLAALSVTDHKQARRWTDSAVARLGLEPTTGSDELILALENCDVLEANGYNATAFLDDVESLARAETFAVTMARAIRARTTGSPRQVVRLAERAAKLPGATPDAGFVIAGALLEDGDFVGAQRTAQTLFEQGATGALGWDEGDVLLIAAAAAEEVDGPDAALEVLNGAEPTHRVMREVGRLRGIVGDEEGARMALRSAFEANANDPTTVFENARFEVDHDHDTALDFLAHLVDIAPHYGWAITGEAAFEPLHDYPRFRELLKASSTIAASLTLSCDFDAVSEYAAKQGWVWRWLGRKTVAKPRLVSWSLSDREASAFFIDDAVSGVTALVFYGDDAAEAAEETARALEGSLQLRVKALSADPLEALEQLRLAGWTMSQGLTSQEAFDRVVLECLEHHDAHVQWRAASAASMAESDDVDTKLRELAYAAEDPRVREEALFTLRQSGGNSVAINHHERWETYLVHGARDAVERELWGDGLIFVSEHEPDARSSYEMTWASEDGTRAVSYVEDELHGVTLLSFAGEADDLVRSVAAAVELRSLEDVIAAAREDLTPSSVRAVAALVPETPVDDLVAFTDEVLASPRRDVRLSGCEMLAGARDWLPAAVCEPVSAGVTRVLLSPLETPQRIAEMAAQQGWRWVDADPTADRDHPSPRVVFSRDGEELALNLHRFGFWSIDVSDPSEATLDSIAEAFHVVDAARLVERVWHPDASVRADAVHQLGIHAEYAPSADVIEALSRALDDESLEVRTHALEATCIAARLHALRDKVAHRVDVEPDNDLRDYAAVLLDAMG
jgi:tetratricopeptide (TPR) repeat protein